MPHKKLPENLSWSAPSHIEHSRSSLWYLVFAFASLGLIAYAVYTHSWLTGLTFILIIIVVLILSSQSAKETSYKITLTGITVGRVVYPFKIIKKFWILYDPPHVKTLNFETTAYINNKVVLQLGDQDPVMAKLVLAQYLKEDLDAEESLTESLARRLKI